MAMAAILRPTSGMGRTVTVQTDPMSQAQLRTALDLLKTGNFCLGEEWENAHAICQAHEGTPVFDWLHALIHRIEGDDANAGYWYRRAAKTRHSGSVEDEWKIIQTAAGGT